MAHRTRVPVAALRGAISSYADLAEGPADVRVCVGTSCALAGGEGLAEALGGAEVSGGQRSRIALARVIVSEAPVMILHEPTPTSTPSRPTSSSAASSRCRPSARSSSSPTR